MTELTSNHNESTYAQRLLADVEAVDGLEKLRIIMRCLRDEQGGCPWDKAQDYDSLIPFTIEEVYEVAETIENKDFDSLKGELGDLLFQIVFYAQIAFEQGRFELADVIDAICDKLIRRHPHVFADANFQDQAALNQAWEAEKHKERQAKLPQSQQRHVNQDSHNAKTSVLDDIPKTLPELKRAQKIQHRVARVGFDWDTIAQVWAKVDEECLEVKEAAAHGDRQHLEEELGDLMFALVNLSRFYGVDADQALRKASFKFEKRFRHLEQNTEKDLQTCDIDELEAMWSLAKKSVASR